MRYDKEREAGYWKEYATLWMGLDGWDHSIVKWLRPPGCLVCGGKLEARRTWWFCEYCVDHDLNSDYDVTGKRWVSLLDPLLFAIIESEIYDERE